MFTELEVGGMMRTKVGVEAVGVAGALRVEGTLVEIAEEIANWNGRRCVS